MQQVVHIEASEIQRNPEVRNRETESKNTALKLLITKAGEKRFIKTSVASILGSHKHVIGKVYVYHDITAHELAKQALHKSEERYRQFFEDDLTGDFIANDEGTILICNQAFAAMLGFNSVTEVIKTNLATYSPTLKQKNGLIELLQKEKKLKQFNTKFIDKNNQPLYITANIVGEFNSDGRLKYCKGYLIDNDSDGTYETFYNSETGNQTDIEQQEDERYLIDSNGDGTWNYVYDPTTDVIISYADIDEESSNEFSFSIFVIIGIGVIVFLAIAVLVKKMMK